MSEKMSPRKKLKEVKRNIGRDETGKIIYKSFYGKTKREATRAADEFTARLQTGEAVTKEYTFEVWGQKCLETFVKPTIKTPNTYYDNFERPFRLHLCPTFGQKKISQILPIEVQEFLNQKSKVLSLDYMKKIRGCAARIFDLAVENGLCLHNPLTKNVKVPLPTREAEDDELIKPAYTLEQFGLVIEYAKSYPNKRIGTAIVVMMYTSAGRSEVLGLRRSDFTQDYVAHIRLGVTEQKDLETGKYRIVVSTDLKNDFRVRDVPIPKYVYDMVQALPRVIYVGGNEKKGIPAKPVIPKFLFHDSEGNVYNPRNWADRVFKTFMRDMSEYYAEQGIDVPLLTPHGLRRTAASVWAANQVDLFTIARLGGWTDMKMLMRKYGRPDLDAIRKHLGYDDKEKTSG